MPPARADSQGQPPRTSYHHGDLPKALLAATFELIDQNGVRGFSVAEAARRTGVSISAPYRHFADREELLAACAIAACEELGRRFDKALAEHPDPPQKLAAVSAAYVRFAAEQGAMFEVLFHAGLDKARHPALAEAAAGLMVRVTAPAGELIPARLRGGGPDGGASAACSDEATAILVQALTGLAQGYASLLLEGSFGELPEAVEPAARRVAAATLAMLSGRDLLFGADGGG